MCEHTRYLSELQERVRNILRQAVRAAGVVGVPLAVLDCHTCLESRSQEPEEALRQTGWAGLHENGET